MRFRGASIGAMFGIKNSKLSQVNIEELKVRDILHFKDSLVLSRCDLNGLHVHGQLSIIRCHLYSVSAELSCIDKGVLLSYSHFEKEIKFINSKIGSNLELTGATFNNVLDFSGSIISQDLRLASFHHPPPKWSKSSKIILRNVSAYSIQDSLEEESWPTSLDIRGFTPSRLGGLQGDGEAEMLQRPAKCYAELFERDPHAGPQPYRHFAKLFREAGQSGKADRLLYLGRKREMREAWGERPLFKAIGLTLQWLLVGFGIGNYTFNVIFWVALMTVLGACELSTVSTR